MRGIFCDRELERFHEKDNSMKDFYAMRQSYIFEILCLFAYNDGNSSFHVRQHAWPIIKVGLVNKRGGEARKRFSKKRYLGYLKRIGDFSLLGSILDGVI